MARDSAKGCLSGMRILVVEDDAIAADLLGVKLEEQGATVVGPSNSVGSALEILGTERIDFALVDMVLRDRPADPLFKALEERDIPHIVITGYSALPTNAPETAVLHVMKPIQWEFLWKAITPFAPT